MVRTHRYHFGTSSWSEKNWLGAFYQPGTTRARLPSVRDTFIYANNHYAGFGPEPARGMVRWLGQDGS